jgi:hypothetical protein
VTILQKFLFSIPAVVGLAYVFFQLTGFAPFIFDHGYNFEIALLLLFCLHMAFLIRRLWSFKSVDRKTKWDWTWIILLCFYPIGALIYIWKQDDQFLKLAIQ